MNQQRRLVLLLPLVLRVLLVVVALGSMGCKRILTRLSRKSTRPVSSAVAVASAPTPSWKDIELTFPELPKARGSFSFHGMDYVVTFSSLPPGTKVNVGALSETAGIGGYVTTKVDVSEELGTVSPKDAFDYRYKWVPHIPVTLDFGGPRLTVDAPPVSPSYALNQAFKTVADRPLTFGKEMAGPPVEHSIAYLAATAPEILGPARSLADIDLIALHTDLPYRTGPLCKDSRSTDAGASKGHPLKLVDRKVTVYERKTSKVVANQDFKADDTCPMFSYGEQTTTYPALESVKVWLRTVRTR